MAKITKRLVDSLKPGAKEAYAWDDELKGYGVRIMPSGVMSYVVKYRTPHGAQRKLAFARVRTLTPDQARDRARQLLAEIATGADPSADRKAARKAITIEEMLGLYLKAADEGKILTRGKRPKRASTIAIDHGRASRHILPLIGKKTADALTRGDVQGMADKIAAGATAAIVKTGPRGLARVTGGEGSARRIAGFLGGVFTWAIARGVISRSENPCRGVETRADNARDRRLSTDELARIGAACREREETSASAVAALRLIALTGLRRSEAFGLRWSEVDAHAQCLRLENTKTGASVRVVGKAALEILQDLPRTSSPFVFPSRDGKKAASLAHPIDKIFAAAGIDDAGLHDLRRGFASTGADFDLADSTIAALLGHARHDVTSRHYIRRTDATLVAAADRIADAISRCMSGEAAQVVTLDARRA